MTTTHKIAIPTLFLAILGLTYALTAHANPPDFIRQSSATATSTGTFMTPGTATTTFYYDSNQITGSTAKTDAAALGVIFTASSTLSTLGIRYEYSQGVAGVNCVNSPTLCDWYADSYSTAPTTTWSGTNPNSITWTFASTTLVSGYAGTLTIAPRLFFVPTPTRYVRAVTTITGANGTVWGEFIGEKQRP